MAVYVDNMLMRVDVPNGKRTVRGRWSHMFADSREELDDMADKLNMKRAWIQNEGTWKEHYDLTATNRQKALKLGAIDLPIGPKWKEFIEARKNAIT